MADRVFVDTNIVIYAESDDGEKTERAISIVQGTPVLSAQVINEVVSVLSKKHNYRLWEAHEVAESLIDLCDVVPVDTSTIRKAIDLAKRHSLSHWDSLIVAAALLAGCTVLYTEDMQDGQVFDGQLKVINPFAN